MGLIKGMKRQKTQKYEGIAKRAAKSYTQAVKKDVDNIKISSYTTCTSMMALFLTVMRQDFGFGEKRLRALIRKAGYTATCLRQKYVTVNDIATALLEETGFKMPISYQPQKKDYVSSVDANIDRCTDKITAIFMLALRDVFDFGKARLKRVGDAMNDLSGLMDAEEFAKGKHEDKDSWMTKDSSGTYIFSTSRGGGHYRGKLVCRRCGKVFESDAKKKPYYCPACETQGKELKSIRICNEHYKKTGHWNMEPDKIGETARKAKEMGLSYGQYKALMK